MAIIGRCGRRPSVAGYASTAASKCDDAGALSRILAEDD
jgi:hypothetical protein